jgi:hypothetical protein
MPSGSEGNAQLAPGACAMALPASAPARIVAEDIARSTCKENLDIEYLRCRCSPVVAKSQQFQQFIILTIMLLFLHDLAIGL